MIQGVGSMIYLVFDHVTEKLTSMMMELQIIMPYNFMLSKRLLRFHHSQFGKLNSEK